MELSLKKQNDRVETLSFFCSVCENSATGCWSAPLSRLRRRRGSPSHAR